MAVGSEPDATEEVRRLEALVDAQARVLDLVGQNAPLEKILQELADLFQGQIVGSIASILLANAEGTALSVAGAPNLDPAYGAADPELPIAKGSRTCGDAAFRREPVVTSDIDTDPNWTAHRAAARAAGVRACWAVPITGTDDRLLGVFAAYWSEPTSPTDHDLWVQHQFARLTQVAIERAHTVDRITALLAEERRRIAGDIHDDPIQAITAVGLRLQRLAATASADQQVLLGDAQTAVKGAIERLRHMLFELHPPTLEEDGLAPAVEAYLATCFDDDAVAWAIDDGVEGDIPPAIASLAYRLTREAVSNVAKHAQATKVEVALSDEDGGLVVRVRDDGRGFDVPNAYRETPGHMGLANCRYLAQRALGWWSISSDPGATTVQFYLPLRES